MAPELAVTGYPPRDLLLKSGFIEGNLAALEALAADIGLDPAAFETALHSPETQTKLEGDFALRSAVGAYSFPSVGLLDGEEAQLIATGWCDAQALATSIREAL